MRMKFLVAVLLVLPLPAAMLICGKTHALCHAIAAPFSSAGSLNEPECCGQGTGDDTPKQESGRDAPPTNPTRQIVFRVEGLTCPAVKGIGCGQVLFGILAKLERIEGVGASSANYTGTMIRISVAPEADRDQVTEAVSKVLASDNHKGVRLAGDEFQRALDKEEWRGAERIGELSAIEFHTLALHRVTTFAKVEKLDEKTADKLAEAAEQQWKRLTRDADAEGATRPQDWGKRIKASLPAFLQEAKKVLDAEQLERFQQTLTGQCADEARPEAPPAPLREEKRP